MQKMPLISYLIDTFTTTLGNTAWIKYDFSNNNVFVRYAKDSEWIYINNIGMGKSYVEEKLVNLDPPNEFAALIDKIAKLSP